MIFAGWLQVEMLGCLSHKPTDDISTCDWHYVEMMS